MMKPITGQYECVHSSGVGLDYFTSRVDRLIIQGNGRFSLIIQSKSRVANAAHSLVNGQQVTNAAPETKREGYYGQQNEQISLTFDDGTQEHGQLTENGEGLQIGTTFFSKVSDSTFLPPTNRLQKDMDDIAKGLKIASTIGGFALKAAKGIQSTIQSTQSPGIGPTPMQPPAQQPNAGAYQPPVQQSNSGTYQPPVHQEPFQDGPATQHPIPPAPSPPGVPPQAETIFCDQCGARARPGKRFCGNCGAKLY
jgi:hypothetical protein